MAVQVEDNLRSPYYHEDFSDPHSVNYENDSDYSLAGHNNERSMCAEEYEEYGTRWLPDSRW